MASRKGIAITAIILGAITLASFLVWLIPQNYEATFVISNFETHLDDVKKIHNVIIEGTETEFQNLLDAKTSPDEYIEIAEISSSQINSQIIQLVESDAPEEWYESYLNYLESLRSSNSKIRETIAVAQMIKNEAGENKINDILEKIEMLKQESISYAYISDNSRP